MSRPPLKIAVVGHTNTGKTSLMRTLLRDVTFGEVSDRPATTRHVEGAVILLKGVPALELYDTPGLEDSIGLLDHLTALRNDSTLRTDGTALIQNFLNSTEAHGRFAQEAKALRQVLASDAALYVIDARDRVLGKHRDELNILSFCARPVIPVLNFIASPDAQTSIWREHLARANMHAVAEFDTVVLDEQSERQLLEKMRSLLDVHRATIDALINERRQQRERLIHASAALVADLLVDVAAHAVAAPMNNLTEVAPLMESLKHQVRRREQEYVDRLLELHRFRADDYQASELPLTEGRWGVDLFNPAALKQFGVRTGSAAAAGAMVGLTVDAMVGGLSLGAGAAVGAAIGALLGTGHSHGKRLIDRLRGRSEIRCDDATLQLLLARSLWLIQALLRRGHASTQVIQSSNDAGARSAPQVYRSLVKPMLDECRLHPSWSRLSDRFSPAALGSAARQAVVDRLTKQLEDLLHPRSSPSTT